MPLLLLLLTKKQQIQEQSSSTFHFFPISPEEKKMMRYQPISLFRQTNILFIRSFMILFFSCIPIKLNLCFSGIPSSLKTLPINGHFSFDDIHQAARDFGNRYQYFPLAVLHPKSVSDIATTIKHIWQMGPGSELTLAARGHGHSLEGQAQAHRGIVINMESLRGPEIQVYTGKFPYVDVPGGELWINVLHESLKHGLAPKSWTDYLHLSVGGTLSNAGISGQAFRHGPQISNVHLLEVVTGSFNKNLGKGHGVVIDGTVKFENKKLDWQVARFPHHIVLEPRPVLHERYITAGKGEVITCSEKQNADLFHSILGGLGQFGIITRARITLEPAPQLVKWIRVLYSDFSKFTKDQEHLISEENTFDYIEGFVILNRTGLINNWRSSFNPQDPVQASQFKSDGRILFCLELAKNYNPDKTNIVNKEIESLLSQLSYISSTLFLSEASYVEFLDRVHLSEVKLRSKGLWEVPHPWLNLLIPQSKIHNFAEEVFGNILTDTSNGPILIYPVNKSKWDNRTSIVLPEEGIFYLVAFLPSAVPSSTGTDSLEHILTQNKRILDFCEAAHLGVKQYLPHYNTQEEWMAHFGSRWEAFIQRKSAYDPLAILAPGQRIFHKAISIL